MRSLAPLPLLALLLAACSRAPDAARAPATTPTAAPAAAAAAAAAAPAGASLYALDGAWRDARGATLRLADLAGRPRVVALVYTSCHTTCPLILRDLKAIEASLPAAARERVGFVLVSIDPARDTPGRLAEWGAAAGLDPARWTLLSGSDASTRELAVALGIRYQALPGGEVAHTNAITVLDAGGAIAHLRPDREEPLAQTTDAVAALLR